jgi:Ribosome-associated heat shock protein implicated in the recycling of the 50S subunit (S4 paralog)
MYHKWMTKHDHENKPAGMRLDKWLWCARFFKTRGLAADAIRNGRVSVNEERAKHAKYIETGAELSIHTPPFQYHITVVALSASRKSAADAALLYTETRESIARRETQAAQLRLDAALTPGTRGRPSKRERRQLISFKNRR